MPTWVEAQVVEDPPWLIVRGAHSDEFAAELFRLVPVAHRSWDAANASWRVHFAFADVVVALLHEHAGAPTSARLVAAYETLHLTQLAPIELVEAAYRTLTRLYLGLGTDVDAQLRRLDVARSVVLEHLRGR
jgi:hypothetical protein